MDIFTDYVNWKFENHEFIQKLVKNQSKTISRFTSVIVVVDYLYDQYIKNNKLSEDEQVFFEIGFDYIYDNFYTLKTILDYQFNGDYIAFENCGKTINLLLYVNEFQAELLQKSAPKKDIQSLDDFEQKILKTLEKKENVDDAFFPILNDIVTPIFERNDIDFVSIESIFYEVAVEYDLYQEDEFNMYNAFLNFQKEKIKSGN